jgi:hypothetical protein
MDGFLFILCVLAGFVGLVFLVSFLMFLPALFSREARSRRPLMLPRAEGASGRAPRAEATKPPLWQVALALPFGALVGLAGIPVVFAMVCVAGCGSYLGHRRLAYRYLRRRHSRLAFALSFPVGLRVFMARMTPLRANRFFGARG